MAEIPAARYELCSHRAARSGCGCSRQRYMRLKEETSFLAGVLGCTMFPLAPCLVSFPSFSTAPSRFLSRFRETLPKTPNISVEIVNFLGPEPSLRLFWGKTSKIGNKPGIMRFYLFFSGIPGKYPGSCRVAQFCLRFCPRPALRLRETREFPEWSTKQTPSRLCFPWKFPETQSARLLVLRARMSMHTRRIPRACE